MKVDEQLKEIGKLNPNIRELKDLAAMETYPKFYELVKKGTTLVDAYRLANFEALTSSAAAATGPGVGGTSEAVTSAPIYNAVP